MESNSTATKTASGAALVTFPIHSRLLAATGLVMLGGIVWHLASHWAVAQGNQAWLTQHPFAASSTRGLGLGFVALYAALGVGLWVRKSVARSVLGAVIGVEDRLLFVSGILAFAYVAWHSWPFVSMVDGPHHSSFAVLQAMLDQGGGIWRQFIPVFGACALGLHAALGAPRALCALTGLSVVKLQVPMQLLGVAILIALAHLLSYLATGFGLW